MIDAFLNSSGHGGQTIFDAFLLLRVKPPFWNSSGHGGQTIFDAFLLLRVKPPFWNSSGVVWTAGASVTSILVCFYITIRLWGLLVYYWTLAMEVWSSFEIGHFRFMDTRHGCRTHEKQGLQILKKSVLGFFFSSLPSPFSSKQSVHTYPFFVGGGKFTPPPGSSLTKTQE